MQDEVGLRYNFKCASCGETMHYDTINVEFGYGSSFDEDVLMFCSDKCLRKWAVDNIKEGK